MITTGGSVKVLDFGLAKLPAPTVAGSDRTRSSSGTRAGMILGTPAYMSPEQARGKSVDKRTDVWAFGCVLFEMLCGIPAFRGDTSTDIVAAVLERDPDWSRLPATTPMAIEKLARRCLKKNPAERLHDLADARLEIAEAIASPEPRAIPAARRPQRGWIAAAMAIVIALAALGYASTLLTDRTPPEIGFLDLTIPLPEFAPGYGFEVAPDGHRIAIGGLLAGRAQIFLQSLDGSESSTLPAVDVGVAPFWSPDSKALAYVAGGKLWKFDIGHGPAVAVCDAPGRGAGSWSRDGELLFAAGGKLLRVAATGGTPQPVTVNDPGDESAARTWPVFLSDNRHFIYHLSSRGEEATYLASLDNPAASRLIESPFPAKYVAPGYLLFIRGTALIAQRLDGPTWAFTGEPMVIARDVAPGYVGGMPSFSASANGVLAFVPSRAGTSGQLTWYGANGRPLGHIQQPPRVEYLNPALSRSGEVIAVNRMDPDTGNWDIWTLDSQGLPTRQTTDPALDIDPVWAPDGNSIVFTSYRGQGLGLYRKVVGSSTPEERVMAFDDAVFSARSSDWSSDGSFIVYEITNRLRRTTEIWALPLDGKRQPFPLVKDEFTNYGSRLSPDGRWIAFNSYADGAFAVYVQRVSGGQRARVTGAGGVHPRWTSNGNTIVFWSEPGGLWAVDLTFGPAGPRAGTPRVLVADRVATLLDGRTHFDATQDGQRFLMRTSAGQSTSVVHVLVNWAAQHPQP